VYTGDGRTIFDWEPFCVDLDDAPIFDTDTDSLSIEPIFVEVLFDDTEPNYDGLGGGPIFDTYFDDQPMFD
jgi:hypothetical protein